MARITLDRDECDEGFLPPVCVRCGEPASGALSQTFQWYPKILIVTIFVCVPIYILLYLLLRKRMTVVLPVCDRHRSIWVRRNVAIVAGVISMIAGIWFGAVFGEDIDRYLNFNSTVPLAIFGGVFVGVILLVVAGLGAVGASRITADTITLSGVSPVFADTVEQYRILIEDDE